MLIKSEQTNPIFLEIYKIDEQTLTSVDGLEEPFGYHRERVQIGEFEDVWIYYFGDNVPPQEFSPVKGGNFKKEEDW